MHIRIQNGEHGTVSSAIRITMGALCDAYLEDKRINAKASTYIAVRKIIENHIRPTFAERIITEISKADIRDWKNELMQAETVHGKKYTSSWK